MCGRWIDGSKVLSPLTQPHSEQAARSCWRYIVILSVQYSVTSVTVRRLSQPRPCLKWTHISYALWRTVRSYSVLSIFIQSHYQVVCPLGPCCCIHIGTYRHPPKPPNHSLGPHWPVNMQPLQKGGLRSKNSRNKRINPSSFEFSVTLCQPSIESMVPSRMESRMVFEARERRARKNTSTLNHAPLDDCYLAVQ